VRGLAQSAENHVPVPGRLEPRQNLPMKKRGRGEGLAERPVSKCQEERMAARNSASENKIVCICQKRVRLAGLVLSGTIYKYPTRTRGSSQGAHLVDINNRMRATYRVRDWVKQTQ
jgi:hypothetical protein